MALIRCGSTGGSLSANGITSAHKPSKEIEGLAIPDAAVIDMDELRADWHDWRLAAAPAAYALT